MFDSPVLGVQRLALAPVERADAVLTRAFARGVRWVDVADVYGAAPGDAERWLARALDPRVRIATKGGLVRENGRWRPDGRASHLERAAIASLGRLGRERIDLYQLHAPDPRVPLATSVRALARLHADGVIGAIGVSNVNATELAEACDLAPIAAVQVELSPLRPRSVRAGVIEAARARGLPVLAYRPLGGADGIRRLRSHRELGALAAERGVTPEHLVLAWLAGLGVAPLAGPTRIETVDATIDALAASLDPEARDQLDGWFEAGRLRVPRALRRPAPELDREVVLIMGSPGSGKTTRARAYADSHLRLNRDERGGTLDDLAVALDAALADGARKVVLDNTYPSRAQRNPVIEAAWRHGIACRCEWVATSDGDAEINVVLRVLAALGGALPEPEAFERLNRADPGVIPPRALSKYRGELEPPCPEEGFERIDVLPFARAPWPGEGRALLLDPKDLVPSVAPAIHPLVHEGYAPIVVGWESAVDRATLIARWRERAEQVGIAPAAIEVCNHPAGPPVCWCRKPLPGLVIAAMTRLGCDPGRSLALGRAAVDRRLAENLGIPLVPGARPAAG